MNVSRERVDRLLDGVLRLPALSPVVVFVLRELTDADTDIQRLARLVESDQSIAAALLRMANSAFFGMSRKVHSIADAILVLGFHNTRSLVLATGVMESCPPPVGGSRFDRVLFWQHAIGTAVAARTLAPPQINGETAFAAGLLHDLGIVALDSLLGDEFSAVLRLQVKADCDIGAAERAVLGFDHGWVGGRLAEHWRLPPALVAAIAAHHAPDDASEPLTDLVHLADVVCQALDIGDNGSDQVPFLSEGAWQRLGGDWDQVKTHFTEIEQSSTNMRLLIQEGRG